ncbi:hypothetical protein A2867_05360 [Candidatus Daviesbacteria bacterium RIFCSPHIGHO2_01_FULL_40_11]|uniref:phosphoglycerate mutase (2,3-diphosphoglycerate-dependent) n=1 Tax=Candidatus Daviesbacteria bacterium RIFCSPHIGHO2_01_FULL_40_11 TaxID=1797762 RepID=A0A1F5JL01_9BACT|nr:MAG: hypothetical protein A2867_05360 [Candidatus Daviesbacteria bacterium RIFCSPHIGHO2_01_FULL_40_11]OGE63142.1 MAG: hypothetical protein A2964_00875 [Candidatus Daviesbacteria bacterium RIFCSPLOWO2_01_FULL_40_27]
MAYLILIRHGITDWNIEGKWQGLTDTFLSKEGKKQAKEVAEILRGMRIDEVYTSELSRTKQMYQEICNSLSLSCPVFHNPALNERDYGIYTSKNKWEVEKQLGHEKFIQIRRGWDYPIPEGESLVDVYNRVVPFYKERILRDLKERKNVLVISSGNTLRALMKYLENISDEDIARLELGFGEIYIFEIDSKGKILGKRILTH